MQAGSHPIVADSLDKRFCSVFTGAAIESVYEFGLLFRKLYIDLSLSRQGAGGDHSELECYYRSDIKDGAEDRA